jgi:hypothetical protein
VQHDSEPLDVELLERIAAAGTQEAEEATRAHVHVQHAEGEAKSRSDRLKEAAQLDEEHLDDIRRARTVSGLGRGAHGVR